jgi:MFS family permease
MSREERDGSAGFVEHAATAARSPDPPYVGREPLPSAAERTNADGACDEVVLPISPEVPGGDPEQPTTGLTPSEPSASLSEKREPSADFGPRKGESRRDYLRREFQQLRSYIVVTSAYLLFSLTDGGIRMIVLLYSIFLGFSAFATALMFSAYELAGVSTNIIAGMIGSAWGIRAPLLIGLGFQLLGLVMLFVWQADNQHLLGVRGAVYVAAAQVLSGAAKDMVKLSGKSISRLVTPESKQTRLFRLVGFITGFKNTFKGLGYIMGASIVFVSYYAALGVMVGIVLIVAVIVWFGLDWETGRIPHDYVSLRRMLTVNHNVGFLCLARIFLFGVRDLWLEVPILYFLQNQKYGFSWPDYAVGLFVGLYTVQYGQIQSWAPQYLLRPLGQMPSNRYTLLFWNILLLPVVVFMAAFIQWSPTFANHDVNGMIGFVIVTVFAFSFVFAVNSSAHSYMIVKYTSGDKVAMTVGFYYMTNAIGRFIGTFFGGLLYTYVSSDKVESLAACFWTSVGFILAAEVFTYFLHDNVGGFRCGPCFAYAVDAEDSEVSPSKVGLIEGKPASSFLDSDTHMNNKLEKAELSPAYQGDQFAGVPRTAYSTGSEETQAEIPGSQIRNERDRNER